MYKKTYHLSKFNSSVKKLSYLQAAMASLRVSVNQSDFLCFSSLLTQPANLCLGRSHCNIVKLTSRETQIFITAKNRQFV